MLWMKVSNKMNNISNAVSDVVSTNVDNALADAEMLGAGQKTLARQFADAMGNDGQRFASPTGAGFADMLERISPWGVRHQRIDDGDITRYELGDGSAIIESRGCWDVEHSEYRFMMECARPDEETVRHHAEILDNSGYDIEPAAIDINFSRELTPEELLFRRIFDVAVAQEPEENSAAGNVRAWLTAQSGSEEGLALAARALARKGPNFGQGGAFGGFIVYDEKGHDSTWKIVWSSHEGHWVDLGTMLELAEQGQEIPDWFESDWVLVRNSDNAWVERCVLSRC
jgi:hypothetical protein